MSKMMVKRDGLWTPMENLKGDTGPLPASNSVTNDALVTDGAKTNTAYLMGNRLTKDAEGELISVDDSYPSAALSLTVEGKSTQVTTTGKNLLNPTVAANAGGWLRRRTSNNSYGTIVDSDGTNCNIFLVPLEDGQSLTYSRGNATKFGFHFVWTTDETLEIGSVLNNIVTLTNYSRRTFTNTTGDTIYVGVAASVNSTTADEGVLENGEGQLEYATAFTSYEPYSGGAASPRPDWPQEIANVDWPSAHITGKNLFGGDDFKTALSKDSIITINEENHYASYGASSGTVNLFDGVEFKEKTAYTIILAVLCTRENTPCNLRVGYTDDTYVNIAAPQFFDGETMQIFKYTSNASKTLKGLYRQNNGGVTQIYYDYWGIFEGDADVDSYELYTGGVGSLLPEGTSLRSLPDGTKDELYLTYLRPSSREGWAWYTPTLTQRVAARNCSGNENWKIYRNYAFYAAMPSIRVMKTGRKELLCDAYKSDVSASLGSARTGATSPNTIFGRNGETDAIIKTSVAYNTVNDFKAALAENPIVIQYPLATPITTQLDPIELPIMQAGITNIWSDPSTNLSVTYERDRNIVISNLEAAAADLATS